MSDIKDAFIRDFLLLLVLFVLAGAFSLTGSLNKQRFEALEERVEKLENPPKRVTPLGIETAHPNRAIQLTKDAVKGAGLSL